MDFSTVWKSGTELWPFQFGLGEGEREREMYTQLWEDRLRTIFSLKLVLDTLFSLAFMNDATPHSKWTANKSQNYFISRTRKTPQSPRTALEKRHSLGLRMGYHLGEKGRKSHFNYVLEDSRFCLKAHENRPCPQTNLFLASRDKFHSFSIEADKINCGS